MICPSLSHGVAAEQHSTVSWRYLFTISYVYLTKTATVKPARVLVRSEQEQLRGLWLRRHIGACWLNQNQVMACAWTCHAVRAYQIRESISLQEFLDTKDRL